MKIALPVLLLALLFSCAGLSGGISGDDIDADMPSAYTGAAKFRITDVEYLRDGLGALLDRDSEWFISTELPAMMQVLGTRYGMTFRLAEHTLFEKKPADEYELSIWIHEMKKANSFPKKNTVSIIFTVKSSSPALPGRIMFIGETGYSVLNSSYARRVMDLMLQRLSAELEPDPDGLENR